jgi:hypothetical protein
VQLRHVNERNKLLSFDSNMIRLLSFASSKIKRLSLASSKTHITGILAGVIVSLLLMTALDWVAATLYLFVVGVSLLSPRRQWVLIVAIVNAGYPSSSQLLPRACLLSRLVSYRL